MIKIDSDLKDMIISALRYAIGRKTYIVNETCEFIKKHSELIDERVKKVMLKDLESTVDFYTIDDIDFAEFMKFAEWLKNFEVKNND